MEFLARQCQDVSPDCDRGLGTLDRLERKEELPMKATIKFFVFTIALEIKVAHRNKR